MKTVQKHWYHATTKENWNKIKKEGLKGEIFLARNLDELVRMINLPLIGDLRKCELALSVKYTPNGVDDDYNPKSWEMIVRRTITTENIKFIKFI